MKLADMKCLGWLDEALGGLTEADLVNREPKEEIDSTNGESVIGEVESDEIKSLWCVIDRLGEERLRLRKEHGKLHLAGTQTEKDCEESFMKDKELADNSSAVAELFWCAVNKVIKSDHNQIGIRKGWKVVSVPERVGRLSGIEIFG